MIRSGSRRCSFTHDVIKGNACSVNNNGKCVNWGWLLNKDHEFSFK